MKSSTTEKPSTTPKLEYLSKFGFSFQKGSGAHTARTMMLEELQLVIAFVDSPDSAKDDYVRAIEIDNCLGKRSGNTRRISRRRLMDLYSLDQSKTIFRALLYFWNRDLEGRPLIALLCALSRDAILRMCAPVILRLPQGVTFNRHKLEELIEQKCPDRFSMSTLKSTVRNVSSTFTKSGHLKGKSKKIRFQAHATPGVVAFALLLGYLEGDRGQSLFGTGYAKLLDCSTERAIELAEEASRRGWIVFKRVGSVMEVLFPNLLTRQEMEWTREQN